jgi:hypothetical protein
MGYATNVGENIVPLNAVNAVALVGGDNKRTLLIISAPSSGTAFLSTSTAAAINSGMAIAAGDRPIVMIIQTHGQLVQKGWSAIASAGTPNMTVYEGFLDTAEMRKVLQQLGG